MTTGKKAKEWGLNRSTVTYYCEQGYIDGARLIEVNSRYRWFIPDDAKKPYISKAKKQNVIRKNILKAIDTDCSFNWRSLHCNKDTLEAIVESLIKDGMIYKAANGVNVLTEKGIAKAHPIQNLNPVRDVIMPVATTYMKYKLGEGGA